jgi:hypothetical protein
MKKKNFFTGSVFQFYVPEIKKYAFCKFFDFTHLSKFHGLLAQVYDKFSDKEDNRIEDLKSCDWLFGPRSMHRWPDLRKDTGWKSLGILSAPDDDKVPDFKGTYSFPYIVEDESSIGKWYVIHDLTKSEDCEYSAVRHLETKILTTKNGLADRTGMEYCRANNADVADFYDLEEEGHKYMYWQMINIPIYSTLPKEIRGKAIFK